jgi:hypothetical protein
MDLPWLVNGDSRTEQRDTAYAKFLNQFENIQVRWGNHYEQLMEDIISSAADYQGKQNPQVSRPQPCQR